MSYLILVFGVIPFVIGFWAAHFIVAPALTIVLVLAGLMVAFGAFGVIAMTWFSNAPSSSSGALGVGLFSLAVAAAGLMLGTGALVGHAVS